MSYYLEFDRIFLCSSSGYTPLWLLGDSSVWEGCGRHRRIVRSWKVFQHLLGVSEAEFIEAVKPMLGGTYQEHWKRNGKWVDDKGLIRWVKNGCKNATTVEDLLRVNRHTCITCKLQDQRWKSTLETDIRTTSDLDDWILRAKAAMESNSDLYPLIMLNTWGEKITHPVKQLDPNERVVIKSKHGYLFKYEEGASHWSHHKESALIFTAKEAALLPVQLGKPVSASVLDTPNDYVVVITNDCKAPCYLNRLTGKRHLLYSYSLNSAKLYSTKAAAKKAAETAKKRVPNWDFAVANLDELSDGT